VFELLPQQNLGCFGDGGMVVSNNQQLADRIEVLRRHGGRVKYHHEERGMNSRLDELQAAILRVKLPHLQEWNQLRRQHACTYNLLLADLLHITRPHERSATGSHAPLVDEASVDFATAVYHQYTILVPDRASVVRRLTEAGIASAVYYPVPLHRQQVYISLGHNPGLHPYAEYVARHCLSLPMFPELNEEQRQQVTRVVRFTCSAEAYSPARRRSA
jgi:dTDP-4-amino-4,6-dideoxygalactose transaminase